MSVDLANLPLSSGIVVFGWSNQQAGSFPLPLSLTPYGMPGCSARVSTDALCFVSGSGGGATLTVPVPLHPGLVGVVFHQQGIAFDPGANAAGLTVTNAARLTIGSL